MDEVLTYLLASRISRESTRFRLKLVFVFCSFFNEFISRSMLSENLKLPNLWLQLKLRMVSDTRSGRHFKDELDGSELKKSTSNGKDLSPHCSQKSKCLEKGTPPSTPPVKRKSERPEKQHTPSPMRMSNRRNKNVSSSSAGSQQSAKELGLLSQREKENRGQAMMESKKAKLDVDSHFVNENKMNARTFKGLFKRQCVMEIVVGKYYSVRVSHFLLH